MSSLPPMRSRHTPRLSGYDYHQANSYFITVVTANRECLFGDIEGEEIRLNDYGHIISDEWLVLPQHHPSVLAAEFIVMPNHLHGIIKIEADAGSVSLSAIVGRFKASATRRINNLRDTPGAVVWQRSFHDRIIRSEEELTRIQQYIADNPLKWALDNENPNRE